jgi:hypothetical protein
MYWTGDYVAAHSLNLHLFFDGKYFGFGFGDYSSRDGYIVGRSVLIFYLCPIHE